MTQIKETKNDFSCGGVVWDEIRKEVLLIYTENLTKTRVWTFPKGHPELGESDQQAALREVREETGWQCDVVKALYDATYWYVRNQVRFHKTVRWFLMKPVKKTGEFNTQEVLECQWCSFSKAQELISYESDKSLLKELNRLV